MHLTTYIRFNIAFALGKLSQYLKKPAKHYSYALKGLICYIRFIAYYAIRFGLGGASSLIGYINADYIADLTNRRSILKTVFILGNGPISWLSQKQKSIATLITEAKYIAALKGAKQTIWLAQLLRNLGHAKYFGRSPFYIELKEDNKLIIYLIKNAYLNDRSKYIDVAYYYIRNLQ